MKYNNVKAKRLCFLRFTVCWMVWWWLLERHLLDEDCYSYTFLFNDDCYHYTFLFDDVCHNYTFLFDNDCCSYTFCLFFQFLNVIFFTFEVIYLFVPTIWIIFAVVLWEGLLGGAAYVNTFYKMSVEVSVFLYWKYLVSVLLHTAFNYNFIHLLLRSFSAMFILGASIIFCSSSCAKFHTAS